MAGIGGVGSCCPNNIAIANIPNVVNISFYTQKSANINISLYNILGEKIADLYNNKTENDYFEHQFDLSPYNTKIGSYIIRIVHDDVINESLLFIE